ncbi:hypothetical protein HZA56_14020 [Candidatus Poribacteria bacterium]|nr:hypothetical protein [Candidatus Poribacteria bacterium]
MLPQTGYDEASVALARLLNQDSIPSSESGRVAFFIASGVQRILRALDIPQTLTYASVTTDANGRVSLATLRLGMTPGIDVVTDGIRNYTLVTPSERYQYQQGNYYFNVVVEAGVWVLYSSEKNATLTLGYYDTPDTVVSGLTPVKIALQPMVVAKAALIYYRQAQDPEADTEQEEDQFRQEIAEIGEAQERRRPQQFAKTRRDDYGHHLGYTGNGRRG